MKRNHDEIDLLQCDKRDYQKDLNAFDFDSFTIWNRSRQNSLFFSQVIISELIQLNWKYIFNNFIFFSDILLLITILNYVTAECDSDPDTEKEKPNLDDYDGVVTSLWTFIKSCVQWA